MKEKLREIFKKYDIRIEDAKAVNFCLFYKELIEWNSKINLTSITQEDEVIVKHFLDSAYPHTLIPINSKVLDIGAGAGFPSIPLKIIRPDLNILMLDSLRKRVNFLNHIIDTLHLSGTKTIHSRIEDLNLKNQFDIILARAVAELPTLIEYGLPFLKIGGFLIAYKSLKTDEEIEKSQKALSILGGKIENVMRYEIGGNQRSIIIVKKIKNSPTGYPRTKNLPKLKPL
jgi:16S rRNA (guanine527-N7)-methyltransferase